MGGRFLFMAIVKQYHKDTDTTYVYESTSYWDAEKGQSRSKRRVIGKIDPATGEIVPTGKRGRSKKTQPSKMTEKPPAGTAAAVNGSEKEQIIQLELTISTLRSKLAGLEEENRRYRLALEKAASLADRISEACQSSQSQ